MLKGKKFDAFALYQECCFPLILFFPFENLIVYFASEYSLYHIIFSLFCCKDTKNI